MNCYKCGNPSDVLGIVTASYFARGANTPNPMTVGICPSCQSRIHWHIEKWIDQANGSVEIELCNYCGDEVHGGIETTDEKIVCTRCFNDYGCSCDECGTDLFRPLDEYRSIRNGNYVCISCFDDNYGECESCGEVFPLDDMVNNRCEECNTEHTIHDYGYKPHPKFHKNYGETTKLFMGLELEVDKGGESNAKAAELIAHMDNESEDYFYIKHDGSLDNGMEIVTHPMTLDYHYAYDYKRMMAKLVRMGYRSHDHNTCGLHVHVSRNAFGNSEMEQQNNIAKSCYLMVKHWDKFVKFSRRNTFRYCNKLGTTFLSVPDSEKYRTLDKDKYYCINLWSSPTVEFRLWRGTLNYQTFMASLEMTDLLVRSAIELDWDTIRNMGFWSLLKYADKFGYKFLHGYCARVFKKDLDLSNYRDDDAVPLEVKDFKEMMSQLVAS